MEAKGLEPLLLKNNHRFLRLLALILIFCSELLQLFETKHLSEFPFRGADNLKPTIFTPPH